MPAVNRDGIVERFQNEAMKTVSEPGRKYEKTQKDEEKGLPGITGVDALVFAFFIVFSLGCFLGRWKGIVPFVFLGSDAGIVASFVAAFEHPDLFQGDVLLGDFTNFRYYLAIHPVLIYFLNRVTGDYGTAYVSLLLLTPLLQAVGFYLLGRVLFQSRYWAFLLSLITLCPIALPIREFWGTYDDPLPRSLFHAFLPYLLAGTLHYRYQPRKWPWLMVGMGLAFYAHPVSAPVWAFAIWLSFLVSFPEGWLLRKKLLYMFVLGVIFVGTTLPWALNFSLVHGRPDSVIIPYKEVVEIIGERVGKELQSVYLALDMWWQEIVSWPLWFYCLWGLGSSVFVAWRYPQSRRNLTPLALWATGILFVSVGLTVVEEAVCRVYDLPRVQMDSIRGIKYLLPLLLVLCFWSLAEFCRRSRNQGPIKVAAMLAGLLLVVIWAYQNPPHIFWEAVASWGKGSLLPPVSKTEQATREALAAVRAKTPSKSKILALALPLEIRYSALRPIVYAYKDGGIFADTNRSALLAWHTAGQQIQAIGQESDPLLKIKRAVELARELGADYVLTDFPVSPSLADTPQWELVWSNEFFSLFRLNGRREACNRLPRRVQLSGMMTEEVWEGDMKLSQYLEISRGLVHVW